MYKDTKFKGTQYPEVNFVLMRNNQKNEEVLYMIGTRLKILREELGLKQEELAQKLSVSPSSIGMYETNKREPNSEIIIKIANFFNVTIDYLLGKSDIRNNNENIENNAFFRVMQNAEKKGYTPEDMQMALDFLDRARKRDTKDEN